MYIEQLKTLDIVPLQKAIWDDLFNELNESSYQKVEPLLLLTPRFYASPALQVTCFAYVNQRTTWTYLVGKKEKIEIKTVPKFLMANFQVYLNYKEKESQCYLTSNLNLSSLDYRYSQSSDRRAIDLTDFSLEEIKKEWQEGILNGRWIQGHKKEDSYLGIHLYHSHFAQTIIAQRFHKFELLPLFRELLKKLPAQLTPELLKEYETSKEYEKERALERINYLTTHGPEFLTRLILKLEKDSDFEKIDFFADTHNYSKEVNAKS